MTGLPQPIDIDAQNVHAKLTAELDARRREFRGRWDYYDRLNKLSLLSILAATLGATVAGLSQLAFVAGVLSAIAGTLIVGRETLGFASRVAFYQRIRGQLENLAGELRITIDFDQARLQHLNGDLTRILTSAIQDKPALDWQGSRNV